MHAEVLLVGSARAACSGFSGGERLSCSRASYNFSAQNSCGLAFLGIMFRMEILRYRAQKDFPCTNLVRERSIFRGKFSFRYKFSKQKS